MKANKGGYRGRKGKKRKKKKNVKLREKIKKSLLFSRIFR